MFNIEFDQDVELRAVQNEDFEQQYLDHCLRDTRKEPVCTYPMISRTLSSKSIEAECLHKKETPYDENTQTQCTDIFGRKHMGQTERRASAQNTGTSLMCSFYIRRFIEKISQNRKRLLNMNETHYNLIEDKASDKQTLFNYQNRKKLQGISLRRMKTLLRQESSVKKTNRIQQIKVGIGKFKKPCYDCIQSVVNKIPVIQPESRFKMVWDFFASFFRIILVVLIPLEISFQPAILFQDYIYLTAVILIILQIDFFIRINTMQYRNGAAIQNRWELFVYQFQKEFLTDLSTTLILVIFLAIQQNNNNTNLFLLLVLAQFKYIQETFAKSDQISYLNRPQRGIFGLLKFLLSLLFILHLFSCIWFWFSQISLEDSWIKFNGLDVKPWELQYLEALYFAVVTMLTIGYGDNVPKNSIEKIITIVFILGACLWFSYSVNFIGGIINDITQNQVERNRKMRVINKYMDQRKIPFNLKHKVKEYLTFRWKEDDEVDLEVEQALLQQLSDELKEELDKQAHKVFIQKSQLLAKFSDDFKDSVSKSIKRKIIQPQNIFSIDFENQLHLCYVEEGTLLYQHPITRQRSKLNAEIKQGQFFGVKEFILQSNNLDYFKSNGYASLLILSITDFLEAMKNYPEDFQKYCELKEKILFSFEPPKLDNGIFCAACLSFNHTISECPQISYIPDREKILKQHMLPIEQKRCQWFRDSSKRFQNDQICRTLLEKDLIQQFAQVFQTENFQMISELQKIMLQYEQESQSSCADISPCNKVQNEGRFQAAITRSKRIISDSPSFQPNPGNLTPKYCDTKANLHQALLKRKKSVFSVNTISGIGKSPKSLIIPQMDEIKENDSENIGSINSSESSSSESEKDKIKKFTIQDFNESIIENITNLYHQLQREFELNENDQQIQIAYVQIERLYKSLNPQRLYDFEIMSSFDYFFKNENYQNVIQLAQSNSFNWQQKFINKLQRYMIYPFQFILKYMSKKRNFQYKEKTQRDPTKRLQNRLNTLKNSLRLKKKSSVLFKTIHKSQIAQEQ